MARTCGCRSWLSWVVCHKHDNQSTYLLERLDYPVEQVGRPRTHRGGWVADAQRPEKHPHQLRHARLVKHAAVAHERVEQYQGHQAVVGVGDRPRKQAQHQRLELPGGDGAVAHVLPQLIMRRRRV